MINKIYKEQDMLNIYLESKKTNKDCSPQEIIEIIKNNKGLEEIWISKNSKKYSCLVIQLNNDLACVNYFPENENDISLLNIHYRKIEICTYSYQEFFEKYIIDPTIKENILREKLYNEEINTLGNLQHNEIFFFVPALVLGGAEDIKYVKKGDANVHQQVLFEIGNK